MVNNVLVKRVLSHKHLGLILESRLDFNEIALLRKVQNILPLHFLLTIYDFCKTSF